jgi:hypothetical protein
MLLAAFNKNWWRSIMKGEDLTEQSAEGETPLVQEAPQSSVLQKPEDTASSFSPAFSAEEEPSTGAPREDRSAPEKSAEGNAPRFQALSPVHEDEHEELRPEIEEEDADGFTHEGQAEFEHDDPLAPAYDIEKGTPLAPHRQEFPLRSNIKSAKEFFNAELLYRYDILEDEDRKHLSGRYRIELKGYQGGVWTLELGNNLDVVNRREEAEIVLTMQQRDFLQLVNGQLNPQLAMFAQKLRIQGDLKKAVAFQVLLAPEAD